LTCAGGTGKYKLKKATKLKADIWRTFELVFEVKGEVEEVHYYRACKKCHKVYQYKDNSGKNFGTKNQLEHIKRCMAIVPQSQMKLE